MSCSSVRWYENHALTSSLKSYQGGCSFASFSTNGVIDDVSMMRMSLLISTAWLEVLVDNTYLKGDRTRSERRSRHILSVVRENRQTLLLGAVERLEGALFVYRS